MITITARSMYNYEWIRYHVYHLIENISIHIYRYVFFFVHRRAESHAKQNLRPIAILAQVMPGPRSARSSVWPERQANTVISTIARDDYIPFTGIAHTMTDTSSPAPAVVNDQIPDPIPAVMETMITDLDVITASAEVDSNIKNMQSVVDMTKIWIEIVPQNSKFASDTLRILKDEHHKATSITSEIRHLFRCVDFGHGPQVAAVMEINVRSSVAAHKVTESFVVCRKLIAPLP